MVRSPSCTSIYLISTISARGFPMMIRIVSCGYKERVLIVEQQNFVPWLQASQFNASCRAIVSIQGFDEGGRSNRPPIPRNSLFTKGTVSRNVLSLQNGKVGGKGISGVPNGTPPLAVALGELIKADSHRASDKNMDVANSSRVLKLKQSLVDFVAMLKEIGG